MSAILSGNSRERTVRYLPILRPEDKIACGRLAEIHLAPKFCFVAIAAALLPAIVMAADATITVRAPEHTPVQLSLTDLSALAAKDVSVQDEKGKPATYRCATVAQVLTRAGTPLPVLRGKTMTQTLRVNAADGYAVVFALPELDIDFTSAEVLVCFQRDGNPMDEGEGPVRMVVPGEKKHARWVRRVTELVLQPGTVSEN